ncbi:MAG: hypothetical protein U0704_08395 [Candidatus Eisenbacteria bacterium]
MSASRSPWLWCWLPALAWLAARVLHVPLVQGAAGVLLVNLLPGLALLRLAGFERRGAAWLWLGAGVLSPPLVGAAALAVGLPHGPIEGVALPLAALSLVVLSLPLPVRGPEPPEWGKAAPEDRAALGLGVALAAVVALGLLNPRLARWSDSWFHAAVFNEILRAGVPVEFPHFAGGPLPYPWFFHVYLVACRPVVNADPFLVMASLNVWTALLWGAAVHVLARAIGLAPRAALASAVVAFVGVNPAGPLLFLAQGLVGETSGPAVLRQMVSDANTVLIALQWNFPMFQATWLGRLWTPTAFNFALALSAFLLALAFELWRAPSTRTTLLYALGTALLVFWHTLTALSIAIALGVGGLLGALPRLRDDARGALGALLRLGLPIVVGFALAKPYLNRVTVGGDNKVMLLALSRLNLTGTVIAGGAVLLLAGLAWRALPARARGLWTGMMVGLVLPCLCFDLPGEAEEKLFYPMFLVAAAAAGATFERWRHGAWPARAATALLVAGGVGTAAITTLGFLGDHRPLRDMVDTPHADRAALYTPDEDAALRWIRERSPREAVFVQPLRPQGTEPILVHGGRRLFLGFAEVFYRATFFPSGDRPPIPAPVWSEVMHRDAVQRAVFADSAMTADDLAFLRAKPWPTYVWWDDALAGGRLSPTLRDTTVARVAFASPSVRILELRPAAGR